MTENPYLDLVHRNLPRLLALYNRDHTDIWQGCGDRQFWAWKLTDFPNATYQGAVYGLALLYKNNMLPDWMSPEACLDHIASMIRVLPKLMDKRGGLSEALPNEGSFCVTGLVLADVLGALELVGSNLPKADYTRAMDICAHLAHFLTKQDEHHGMISNHLATSALGMTRWGKMGNDIRGSTRAKLWIDRIRRHASPEGWMSEYASADPGYQTWCSSSLAQIHLTAPEYDLGAMLERSYSFLTYFAMPDGSFANGAGARLTRFLFAGGAELLADKMDDAGQLALFARAHAPFNRHVTLDSIDAPNMVPLFNDTVLAAISMKPLDLTPALPYQTMPSGNIVHFENAGLLVHRGETHFTTVSIRRGGWMARTLLDGSQTKFYAEPAGWTQKNTIVAASNGRLKELKGSTLSIVAELKAVPRMMPTPGKFLILRLLSLTAFHSLALGNTIKKILATALMKPGNTKGRVMRKIDLSDGDIMDDYKHIELRPLPADSRFSPSHMASQGYWQKSDERA